MNRFYIASAALFSAVMISGCGASVTKITTPNNKPGYAMNCGSGVESCFEKATELCPNGYNIINQTSGTVAVPVYGSMGGVMAMPSHGMAIECK